MKEKISYANGRVQALLGGMKLEFRQDNGAWLSLGSEENGWILNGDNDLSALTLTVDGKTTVYTEREHLWNIRDAVPVGDAFKLSKAYMGEDGQTLHLILEGGDFLVDQSFAYNQGKRRMQRQLRIEYLGEKETLLRWAEVRMPPFSSEKDCVLEMPGYSDFLHEGCDSLPMGKLDLVPDEIDKDATGWKPGVLAAVTPWQSMISWLYGGDMAVFWQIYRGHKGTWLEQKWLCSARMQRGDSLIVGTQYFYLSAGDLREELAKMQDFWDEVDIRIPEKQATRPWAKNPFIYEAHVGEKKFRYGPVHNPHPDVQALIDDLPRIHDLGFTVLEYMPRFPFPGYSVSDYMDIGVCYGDKQKMKELVEKAHALGIRVFLDVVVHGVVDQRMPYNGHLSPYPEHPLLSEHPEYFTCVEDGGVARASTWCFDQANPGFRKYMADVFCYYLRELDVDGFRVDALTWNYFPSWKKGLAYPAYKTMYGCFDLFTQVRDALWEIKPDIALYSETTGPLMNRSFELSYSYDEIWMYECLMPPKVPNLPPKMHLNARDNGHVVNAREAAQWLDLRQKVMPRGWIKVHHCDSHDSHEWRGLGMFRRDYMGLQQSRAFFAYCCFIEGGIMNFAGGEWGSEEVYRDLIDKRKKNPALLSGSCDYVAITSPNENLFAPLRVCDGQTMIPVINFSLDTVNSELDLSALGLDAGAQYEIIEHFSGKKIQGSGKELQRLFVELDGYHYALYEVISK